MSLAPTLLVFGDDWGRHPSGCQHLIRNLLGRYNVTWVNTIGTRRPGFDRQTLQRGKEKLAQWLGWSSVARPACDNLTVLNPVMWPYARRPWDRAFNRYLLESQLRKALRGLSQPPVAVTKVPLTADLMGRLPVRHWVYYACDDLGKWAGLDVRAMAHLQEQAVSRADVVLAVSDVLAGRLARPGRPVEVLTHGVDLPMWKATGPEAEGLADLPRPLVVFWGVVDGRLDRAVLQRLAHEPAVGTLLLVGRDTPTAPDLSGLPRLVRRPEMPLDRLPALARAAAVLVMPYLRTEATLASQPLKLKEYLASGKPVVCANLPATRAWETALDLAATPDAFASMVVQRLGTGLPDCQRLARLRLEEESWAAKSRRFEALAGLTGSLQIVRQ